MGPGAARAELLSPHSCAQNLASATPACICAAGYSGDGVHCSGPVPPAAPPLLPSPGSSLCSCPFSGHTPPSGLVLSLCCSSQLSGIIFP